MTSTASQRDEDARFMGVALALGRRGQGRVWPNPAVGCVVVKDGRIVGRGWTADGGRPHAEPQALLQAGNAAQGATAYVTLEPCAHTGVTPPCADALITAGVARVVVAIEDPDPRVDGGGIKRLRAAGIEVDTGIGAQTATRDHAGFLSRVRAGRPLITLKLATTLDGRIATGTGDSQWITGPQARRAVHAMRANHDAVLVGAGTARTDDPGLTVRGLGVARQPVRCVISKHLDLPLDGQLARTAKDVPVWLIHTDGAPDPVKQGWRDLGAQLLQVAEDPSGQVEIGSALRALGERGLTRVFCEGGGALAGALASAGLVDRLVLFSGGALIGSDGRASLGEMGLTTLSKAPRFVLVDARRIGPDTLQIWEKPWS